MFVTCVYPQQLANTSHLQLLLDVRVDAPTDEFKDCDIFDTQRVNLRGDSMGGMDVDSIVRRAVEEFGALLDQPTGRVVEGKVAGAPKFAGILAGKSRNARKLAELLGLNDGDKEVMVETPRLSCAEYEKELRATLAEAAKASVDPDRFVSAVAALRDACPEGGSTLDERVRAGVLLLAGVEELLRGEGKADGAEAVQRAAERLQANLVAEMRIKTERDEDDANVVRERVQEALKGRVAMLRKDEVTGDRVPTWRESAVVQLAESIARVAADRMGYKDVPEFGILYKKPDTALVTYGLYSRAENVVFINAEKFVELFDKTDTYEGSRFVLSDLRETALHELTHSRQWQSPDCHDRAFWDDMSKMSNDWDVCDGLNELFTAFGLTCKRVRAADGACVLDMVTRTFNPGFKASKKRRVVKKKARKEESEGDAESDEQDEDDDESLPPGFVPNYSSSDGDEPTPKRSRTDA